MATEEGSTDLQRELDAAIGTARPQDVIAALSGVSLVQVVRVLKALRSYAGASQWVGLEEDVGNLLTDTPEELPSKGDQEACTLALEVFDQAEDTLPYTRAQVRATTLNAR